MLKMNYKEKIYNFKNKLFSFFKKCFNAIKKGLIFAFQKIKKGLNKFMLIFKKLSKSSKVLIVSILVIIATFTGVYSIIMSMQKDDLSSYENLFEIHNEMPIIEDFYFNSTYILQNENIIAQNNNILYEVMMLNYEYYLPYLKNVIYTKELDRERLNYLFDELTFAIKEVNLAYENYKTEYELLEDSEEPIDTSTIEVLHNTLQVKQLTAVDISIQVVPVIRYYVNTYSKKEVENRVENNLVEIQYDYAYVIRNLMHDEMPITNQISNLNAIMQKFNEYNKNMTNIYIANFLNVYNDFYMDYEMFINIFAENYYKANDKFSYKESLNEFQKPIVQDFYNFLEQPSYN